VKQVSVNVFAPSHAHAGQKEVLSALDRGDRFILLRAGRKFRKTSLLISACFEKAFETGLTCPYVAPNRTQAKNIAWDDHVARVLDELRLKGVPYKKNEVELSIKLPGGGKVQLLGVENKEALRGISNWGFFVGDELDDWAEDIWPTIIRPNLMTHKAQAILAGTPKGYRYMYSLEQSGNFTPFHFTSHENPDLDPAELNAMIEEYQKMGEGYYRQEILAEYEKPEGTVYREFDPERQVKRVPYDPNLPLHLSFDFGVNDPTAIIWIQPMGGEYRIIDYYEASNSDVGYFVQLVQSKPYKAPSLITADAAGRARSITTNTSPIDEYAKHGLHMKVKDGLHIPDQIRITHKYIKSMFVDESCDAFVTCLLNYKYPEKRSTLLNQENEIPIHDQFSHGMRALEYYFANIDGGWGDATGTTVQGVIRYNAQRKKAWSI